MLLLFVLDCCWWVELWVLGLFVAVPPPVAFSPTLARYRATETGDKPPDGRAGVCVAVDVEAEPLEGAGSLVPVLTC